MPKLNLLDNRYTGICDNCTEYSRKLMKHTLKTDEHQLKVGATVYDCPKCMMKYPPSEWPPKTTQEQVDREIQKAWAVTPEPVYVAPDIHCAICHVKAPVKYTKRARAQAPGNLLHCQEGYLGDITGWMLIEFPTVDRCHPPPRAEGTLSQVPGFREHYKLCPKCAKHVVSTINHHKDGYYED